MELEDAKRILRQMTMSYGIPANVDVVKTLRSELQELEVGWMFGYVIASGDVYLIHPWLVYTEGMTPKQLRATFLETSVNCWATDAPSDASFYLYEPIYDDSFHDTPIRLVELQTWLDVMRAFEPDKIARVQLVRQIVNGHSAGYVDGLFIDAVTANAIITVYDALSPENQDRYAQFSVARMAEIAWKLVK